MADVDARFVSGNRQLRPFARLIKEITSTSSMSGSTVNGWRSKIDAKLGKFCNRLAVLDIHAYK
jgi:hypothetical protein